MISSLFEKARRASPAPVAPSTFYSRELDVQYIDIDDRGFDIQAYLKAAAILPHEFVCFLNSHSRVTSQDWLRKLHAPLLDPGVGLVGATASFESITDTLEVNSKVDLARQPGRTASRRRD